MIKRLPTDPCHLVLSDINFFWGSFHIFVYVSVVSFFPLIKFVQQADELP